MGMVTTAMATRMVTTAMATAMVTGTVMGTVMGVTARIVMGRTDTPIAEPCGSKSTRRNPGRIFKFTWTRRTLASSTTSTVSLRGFIFLRENTKSRLGLTDMRPFGWPLLSAPVTPTTFVARWSLSPHEFKEIGDALYPSKQYLRPALSAYTVLLPSARWRSKLSRKTRRRSTLSSKGRAGDQRQRRLHRARQRHDREALRLQTGGVAGPNDGSLAA